MRVVFVAEYEVPDEDGQIERKMNEVGDALLQHNDAEWRTLTVCIEACAERVVAAANSGGVMSEVDR